MLNPPMPLEVEYGGLAKGRRVHIAGMDKKFISKRLSLLRDHAIGRHDHAATVQWMTILVAGLGAPSLCSQPAPQPREGR